MIITRTPFRVSLLGGGSDYPEFFLEHGGATIVTTINQYCYLTVNRLSPFFEHSIRVSYSRTELVKGVCEIQHPLVRECLSFLKLESGVEITHIADLPGRTGLGSSSAFTVGLLHALHAFRGELVNADRLAREAIHVERERVGDKVGWQDQFASAHGGFLHLQFGRDATVRVDPIPTGRVRMQTLRSNLLLFFTGIARTSTEILEGQQRRLEANTPNLHKLRDLAAEGIQVLARSRDLREFGELLHEGWELKRQLAPDISPSPLQAQYEKARTAGAIGGKLLGAGGGGFWLLFAPPDRQSSVRAVLSDLKEVPFDFEREGSKIIYFNV